MLKTVLLRWPVLLLLSALLASGPVMASSDPWERWNQRVFTFNTFVDDRFMRPVARAYRDNIPRPAQRSVSNLFSNLNDVTVLINNVLQLKLEDAASDTGRLLINTTLGLGGLLDLASDAGFEKNNEDFGQTLGRWGVAPGPYLVLPFLGPSTVRDGFGLATDIMTGPLNSPDNVRLRNSLHALGVLDTRVALLQAESMMFGDEYIFMREAYLQQRQYLVSDGELDDDWDDDWDEWD